MEQNEIRMNSPIPILRIFDERKAREFYVDFLEFDIDWEHRFEEDYPLYMQISSDNCIIHLSEHHGDGSPGARIRVEINEIEKFQEKLIGKKYKYGRPGIQETPWKTREVTVHDPFNNLIIFYENLTD